MNDQKIDELLNLALNATAAERQKSQVLDVGYNSEERKWDLIAKYTGDIMELASDEIGVVTLLNEYAILTVPEDMIDTLAEYPQIEYIEKPKRLFFALGQGKAASCTTAVQNAAFDLYGRGVIVGVIDSGIDYAHRDFRNADGTTRIRYLWDQTITGHPPQGYRIGTEYTAADINEALQETTLQRRMDRVPSVDSSGHGTSVAGIAAGNGLEQNGYYSGMAPESELIIVKLGIPRAESFPRTAELMQAVDYIIRKSIELQMPAAINISFGNTYGSHDGTSLIEQYLDNISNLGRVSIVVGAGNEGASAGHVKGVLREGVTEEVQLAVSERETTLNLQIWKTYMDELDVAIVGPDGQTAGPLQKLLGTQRFYLSNTELLIYYGDPSPYSSAQEIFIDFLPDKTYIDSGIWKLRLIPRRVVIGDYDMWLPSNAVLNEGTRFTRPSEETTLTVPSTASKVITVGAYNSRLNSYADFSGRGYTRLNNQIKPDLVAPGVSVMAPAVNGGYQAQTGTSMATPFVTGAAALLMQWGIVDGNDAYLYGQKLKTYLLSGAGQLPTEQSYPNNRLGFGTLCVRDSLPV